MAIASYVELYVLKKKTPIFIIFVGFSLIILAGFRYFVGADYPIYRNLYSGFSLYTDYSDVFKKATFQNHYVLSFTMVHFLHVYIVLYIRRKM